MKLSRLVSGVIALAVCLNVSCEFAQIERGQVFSPLMLHPGLERYLGEQFRACEAVTAEDYDPEDLRLLGPRWRVTGDFDGNGQQDICLLMKCPGEGNLLIVAVHRTAAGFEHFVLDRMLCGGRRIGTTLDTEGPGLVRVSMADDVEELKDLSNPGILVNVLETCNERLYYWEDGRYKSAYRGL